MRWSRLCKPWYPLPSPPLTLITVLTFVPVSVLVSIRNLYPVAAACCICCCCCCYSCLLFSLFVSCVSVCGYMCVCECKLCVCVCVISCGCFAAGGGKLKTVCLLLLGSCWFCSISVLFPVVIIVYVLWIVAIVLFWLKYLNWYEMKGKFFYFVHETRVFFLTFGLSNTRSTRVMVCHMSLIASIVCLLWSLCSHLLGYVFGCYLSSRRWCFDCLVLEIDLFSTSSLTWFLFWTSKFTYLHMCVLWFCFWWFVSISSTCI